MQRVWFLVAVALAGWGWLPALQAQQSALAVSYPAVRTAREQQILLTSVGVSGRMPSALAAGGSGGTPNPLLHAIEQTIRRVNGNDPESLRRPVPYNELYRLRANLARNQGFDLGLRQLTAMTDYGHALLRESPTRTLPYKAARAATQNRPAFHGNVAELAEARERNLVLTRAGRSSTFDLTEDRFRPRTNFQLKFWTNSLGGIRSGVWDLHGRPWAGALVVTQEAIETGVAAGRLRPAGTYYITTDGSQVRLTPARAFATTGELKDYTRLGLSGLTANNARPALVAMRSAQVGRYGFHAGLGLWKLVEVGPELVEDLRLIRERVGRQEDLLLRLGQHGSEVVMAGAWITEGGVAAASQFSRAVAGSSRLQAVSRWAGPVGLIALGGYAGFRFWQWQAGHITDRQLYTHGAQFGGGLAAGVVGGWAGFKAGAAGGGMVGALFGPEGIPVGVAIGGTIGALGGGFFGGYVGSSLSGYGVSSYFGFKDKEQEAAFVQFLRAHYAGR